MMEERIYELLEEIKPEQDFKNGQNFIEEGMLDSFDVITLVDMLEEEFGVVIDGLDILPDNFSSVINIVELLKKSEISE